MEYILSPLLPLLLVWLALRNGPLRNPWWRGENVVGFTLFIGLLGFSAGFFGPMILAPQANQGPLLGIFITGPLALLLGLGWGLIRMNKRRHQQFD